ncbi:MAG: sulfate ABC transporter permease subunit CysT [Desulfovibrio sp.]|jgi:sulfate transport system permease protein|nr:sulfate ABC transporter permease subunit CysT [Desulfovibrio sp.]
MQKRLAAGRVLPGFGMTMGMTVSFISLMVLIPMAALALEASRIGWDGFWRTVTDSRILAGFRVSFGCAFAAALINSVFGLILAWVLVRCPFPGRRLMEGLIELPFALPTAVAGIALTTLYSGKGWIGSLFAPYGIHIAYAPAGIVIALTFITLPFAVRTTQPALEQLDPQYEEAGRVLGASGRRIFRRIVLPELMPAVLTGFGLSFARGLGEYGSVVFIAGNMPYVTEIAPLLIMGKLESFAYGEATAVALVMLVTSFAVMLVINRIQARASGFAGNV